MRTQILFQPSHCYLKLYHHPWGNEDLAHLLVALDSHHSPVTHLSQFVCLFFGGLQWSENLQFGNRFFFSLPIFHQTHWSQLEGWFGTLKLHPATFVEARFGIFRPKKPAENGDFLWYSVEITWAKTYFLIQWSLQTIIFETLRLVQTFESFGSCSSMENASTKARNLGRFA